MARTAPSGSRGDTCGSEPRTRWALAQAECQEAVDRVGHDVSASQPLVPHVLGSVAPVARAGASLQTIATAPSASPASGNDSLPMAGRASPYSAPTVSPVA